MWFFRRNMPGQFYCQTRLQQLPQIPVSADDYSILETPQHFHHRLLQLISQAQSRIMMTCLYLQDDESGREVMQALYNAKARNPKLHIRVYVDFHRAQRGLIGKEGSPANSDMYYSMSQGVEAPPAIYGVPVKRRELFGVMHLKGCVFDDVVLYSGASINDVYLGAGGRYRLDRYHEIRCQQLADTLCDYVTAAFHSNYAVQDFSQGPVRSSKELRDEIRQLRRHLTRTQYEYKNARLRRGEVGVIPLAGLSKRHNALNRVIMWLIGAAQHTLFICTPYFNPPKPVLKAIENAMASDIRVILVVGDKVANDFYISPGEPFSLVGAVPYIYEMNLRTFLDRNRQFVNSGKLSVRLWKDGNNTYHVKGIYVDHSYALITGNNLNPRAWNLDLENGLVICDHSSLLQEKFMHEQQYLLRHTTEIKDAAELQDFETYPDDVRRVLTKVKRFKASILVKRLL